MKMRRAPPKIAALLPNFFENRFPIKIPTNEESPVTIPITTAGYQIETLSKAKLNPIARASTLVATESTTSITPRLGSCSITFSSSLKADRIIWTATPIRSPKAIQWSNNWTYRATVRPASQPRIGIRNWNKPKWNDNRNIDREPWVAPDDPAPTDTAKASADSPSAIRRTSRNDNTKLSINGR